MLTLVLHLHSVYESGGADDDALSSHVNPPSLLWSRCTDVKSNSITVKRLSPSF